jgi:stage II sporulation protein D
MVLVALATAASLVAPFSAGGVVQEDVTESALAAASAGSAIRIGPASGAAGRIAAIPLEVYVARVLAGEGEPNAPEAARQALAIAIRTYALANRGRHAREGFDLCDSTHCQVPRASTAATRRATLVTAGRILTYNGSPAELYYSASCGGYSESAAQVWPGVDYPYLQVSADDVHADDPPWTLTLTFAQIEQALSRIGFEGRLRDVRISERSRSGRASRLELPGLAPAFVASEQFRAAIGYVTLRSTAFSIETTGSSVRFTGRGFGHGVGMCVIGAGRRAARGESVAGILAQYYPGLELTPLSGIALRTPAAVAAPERTVDARTGNNAIVVQTLASSDATAHEIDRLALRAHTDLSKALGVSVAPITIRVHDSLESFRAATGSSWWTSGVADGTAIELAPVPLLAQREGLETILRILVAELLIAEPLRGRPQWVRVGAARFFAHQPRQREDGRSAAQCPADAELTLAISATARRDAEARAEACFARAYAKQRDWRTIR